MYTLRMLGGISLTDEAGVEIDALLRQSKHIALLAYLASPKPGTWHKRDSILGTFWAEHDQARSRSALRSALYTIRRRLPDNAIRARGDNDLSVDPEVVTSDTARMSDLFDRGEYQQALACYKGEFLPGIYIPDAELFEQWVETERRRTRAMACTAAKRLSDKLEAENDLAGAISAARRNYEIDPDDEGTARRLISLLDTSGDRAQAFAVYDEFRNHLWEAFGVRPSAETVALLDAVRTRHEPGHQVSAPQPVAQQPTGATSRVAAQSLQPPPSSRSDRSKKARPLSLLLLPVAAALVAWLAWPRDKTSTESLGATLVVLPVTNETGDASIDYLATGIGDDLTRRLKDMGGFTIRSAAFANWPANVRSDLRGIARAYGARYLVRISLRRIGDSLQLAPAVIDSATFDEKTFEPKAFSQATFADIDSRIAADIVATVFRRAKPPTPSADVDPASMDLTMRGYHQMLFRTLATSGQADSASTLFLKAIKVDRRNARAWAGLSSIMAKQTVSDQVPFDEGFERASSAVENALAYDSLQGAALANLAALRALKYRKYSMADSLMRRAEAAEPWNPEVYFIKSMLYRNAHLWNESRDAIRVARRLDPLNSLYIEREAILDFCADHPAQALALYQREAPQNVADGLIQGGITRALAMLGRYDEALDSWRTDAEQQNDTALLRQLAGARGKEGYWAVRHAIGLRRLKALEKQSGRVSTLRWMQAYFVAGDSARGFTAMDQMISEGLRAAYRLSCMPDVDEFRNTARFKTAVAKAGGLPR